MNANLAPQIIHDLVERFERNYEVYKSKSGSYNETQVRREFIDPFFEALGWDVNNRDGNAEASRRGVGLPRPCCHGDQRWAGRKKRAGQGRAPTETKLNVLKCLTHMDSMP